MIAICPNRRFHQSIQWCEIDHRGAKAAIYERQGLDFSGGKMASPRNGQIGQIGKFWALEETSGRPVARSGDQVTTRNDLSCQGTIKLQSAAASLLANPHHHQPQSILAVFRPNDRLVHADFPQLQLRCQLPEIGPRMTEANRRHQPIALSFEQFHGEGESPPGPQGLVDGANQRLQIAQVNEHIRGQHEIELACAALGERPANRPEAVDRKCPVPWLFPASWPTNPRQSRCWPSPGIACRTSRCHSPDPAPPDCATAVPVPGPLSTIRDRSASGVRAAPDRRWERTNRTGWSRSPLVVALAPPPRSAPRPSTAPRRCPGSERVPVDNKAEPDRFCPGCSRRCPGCDASAGRWH